MASTATASCAASTPKPATASGRACEPTPKSRWGTIHMVRNGQRMWMFNERGELIIARLSPQGYEEISRAKLIEPTRVQLPQRGGVCWSHPAYANQHVFARNDEELVSREPGGRAKTSDASALQAREAGIWRAIMACDFRGLRKSHRLDH